MQINQVGAQIINLRFPNAYTGKGIKEISQNIVNKTRKQQQRW